MGFFSEDDLAALSATTVRVAPLVELRFSSETMRLWNGLHDIETGGHTWQALKGMGAIDGIPLAANQQAASVTLTLSGIPDGSVDILAKALEETEDVNQKTALLYLQIFDAEWQPSGNPIPIWWGFMQPPKVTRTAMQDAEGATQAITVTAVNAFFNRSRPPAGRYTDRDQQQRSPGDKFFQFTPSLLFKVFTYPDY